MKPVSQMSDDEVLAEARDMGPDMIGQELFDRAQSIEKHNPGGVLGPAFFDAGATPIGQAGKGALAVKDAPAKAKAPATKAPAKAPARTRSR